MRYAYVSKLVTSFERQTVFRKWKIKKLMVLLFALSLHFKTKLVSINLVQFVFMPLLSEEAQLSVSERFKVEFNRLVFIVPFFFPIEKFEISIS